MRAVANDEQGEPDPQHFERFCHAIVLEMLTDVCRVGIRRIVLFLGVMRGPSL